MKYIMMIRSKPICSIPIERIHEELINTFQKGGGFWNMVVNTMPPVPVFGKKSTAEVDLKVLLNKPSVTGHILYVYRSGLRDEALFDDHLFLRFDPNKVDYVSLIDDLFPRLLTSFNAYLGFIGNEVLFTKDYDKVFSQRLDYRKNIYRLYNINFFSSNLLTTAIKKNPEDIISRLFSSGVPVKKIGNGVLLYLNRGIIKNEEALELNEWLNKLV